MTTAGTDMLPPPGVRRGAVAALMVFAAAAVVGAAMGVRSITGGGAAPTAVVSPATTAHTATHKVGDEIPTGFGWIAVALVDKASGVPSSAVGGNTHFPSFVGADKVQVQVTLDIRNTLPQRHEVRADQFALLSGATRHRPGGATAAGFQIQPDASVGQILSYTVPRNNRPLTLVFTEAPGAPPIKVDLGRAQARVEGAAPGAVPGDSGHGHPSSSSTPGKP